MKEFTEDIEANMVDVYTLTGPHRAPEVVDAAVAQASVIIETLTGVMLKKDERSTAVSVSDAAWVRRAIVFQAAWLTEQVDALSRTAVRSLTQDGLRIDTNTDLDLVLAPMAKRALSNCSWTRSGTITVSEFGGTRREDFLVDDNHPWTPMGSA